MDDKLFCEAGIDELHSEMRIILSGDKSADSIKQSIGDESGILGGEYHVKEILFEAERRNGENRRHHETFQYH